METLAGLARDKEAELAAAGMGMHTSPTGSIVDIQGGWLYSCETIALMTESDFLARYSVPRAPAPGEVLTDFS